MREGLHLLLGEGVHLIKDGSVRLVEAGVAERRRVRLRGDEVGEALLDVLRRAGGDDVGDLVLVAADLGARDAELLRPDQLELAHRDAAGDLRQVLGEGGGEDQLLELAESALGAEPSSPDVHLPQALDGGRQPREAVRLMLGIVDAPGCGDLGAYPGLGRLQDFVGGGDRALGTLQQRLRAG